MIKILDADNRRGGRREIEKYDGNSATKKLLMGKDFQYKPLSCA